MVKSNVSFANNLILIAIGQLSNYGCIQNCTNPLDVHGFDLANALKEHFGAASSVKLLETCALRLLLKYAFNMPKTMALINNCKPHPTIMMTFGSWYALHKFSERARLKDDMRRLF